MIENEFIPLSHRFISVTGADAEKFLQGQSSCDLTALDNNHACFGTFNTPKGRMYSLFKAVRIQDGFLLGVQHETLPSIIEKLNKYKVFFKCTLQEDAQYRAFGLILQPELKNTPVALTDLPTENMQITKPSEQKVIFKVPNAENMYEIWMTETELHQQDQIDQQITQESSASQEEWFARETLTGIPELYPSTEEKFILQTLNLQELGAVSFSKGCYTGQEIIARMKFLGKQKKKMYCLRSNEKFCVKPSSDIIDSEGHKCGLVVRSHYSKTLGSIALGILNIDNTNMAKSYLLGDTSSPEFSVNEISY